MKTLTASSKDLSRILSPRSVAVVGAPRKQGSVGQAVFKNILLSGYKGSLYLVNPNTPSIDGIKCYASLAEIGEPALIVQMVFPKAGFTQEEAEFFGREFQTFSLNGSTPKSFQLLQKASTRLTELGGRVSVTKLGNRGMILQLFVPTDAKNPSDATAKLRLIERELRAEISKN